MDESSIPEIDETTLRMGCLQAATSLNEARREPHENASDVIADAMLFEHYVSDGATMMVQCDPALRRIIR